MKGWAINELKEIQGGPGKVRVHTTTEHPDSSYGIPVWIDSKGNSYGQVLYPRLGWKIIQDKETAAGAN